MPPPRRQAKADWPLAPDLPPGLEPAPSALASRDEWEGVEADATVHVPDSLADVSLRESVLTRVDLVGRRLTGLRCQDVTFVGCDLSGTILQGCHLVRVGFRSCRLGGTVLSGATLQDVLLDDCVAPTLDLRMATVRRTTMRGCALTRADFYQATLDQVRLVDGDLTQAVFTGATTSGLQLHGSVLDGIEGASSLAGVQVDAGQVAALGAALVAALGVRVT